MDAIDPVATGLLGQPIWVFTCVVGRLMPVLVMAPPTRSAAIPRRVRALLAIAISLVLTPIAISPASSMPPDLIHGIIAFSGEMLLGLLLGSIFMLAIVSMQIAGQIAGHLAGFEMGGSSGSSSDATGDAEEGMPILSSLMSWIAVAILLLAGGHRQLMDCCLESFATYPIGEVRFESAWFSELEQMFRHALEVGIRAAAPMAVALLIANFVIGLLGRTLPQLNVLAVGFSINSLVLLSVLSVSIGGVGWMFQNELAVWIESCHRVVTLDR